MYLMGIRHFHAAGSEARYGSTDPQSCSEWRQGNCIMHFTLIALYMMLFCKFVLSSTFIHLVVFPDQL